mgnify:FL=1
MTIKPYEYELGEDPTAIKEKEAAKYIKPLKGQTFFAFGDIHGMYDTFLKLLYRVMRRVEDSSEPVLVFLGDYVDRGPDSAKVVARIREIEQGFGGKFKKVRSVFIRGNHDQHFIDSMNHGNYTLLGYPGGAQTAVSYAGNLDQMLDDARWLEQQPNAYYTDDFFFTHAGVNPDVPLMQQNEETLHYIRRKFLIDEKDYGRLIVHGHTITDGPDVRSNRVGLDTGSFKTGVLTCGIFRAGARDVEFISADGPPSHVWG